MPALIDIRRRIRSVKSTQQITKAMSFSAAEALLRRPARIHRRSRRHPMPARSEDAS
jgi:F0F1-type ATP synthase gamma subunit